MNSLNLQDELTLFAKEILQTNSVPFKFYFWDIPESRKQECEGLFDFVKDIGVENMPLRFILNNKKDFGVEHVLNKNGFYTLIRFVKNR